jgi:protein tyrosine kinase modulator
MHALILRILDDVRGSWRFRRWALVAAWVFCLLGWIWVVSLPNVYKATARVYVDSQSALRPLLKGIAVDPSVESNLAIVRQAILSRPNLERVARDTDLDLRAKTPEKKEELIDSIARRILIETDVHSSISASDGVYRISFLDASRPKSVEVVRTLLDSFVEDTRDSKRTGQEEAQRFLKEQIATYEKQLTESENRLSEFKKRNVGTMPSDRGDYFTRYQNEMTQLEQVRQSLALAEARRVELSRQLSGEEPFMFGFDSSSANTASPEAGGDIAFRIRDLEKRREELLLRYTAKHPEVIAVESTIEELRARQAEELERLHKGQGTGILAQSVKANPTYQGIEGELRATEVQVAELRQDLAQRRRSVAELQRMVNTVPEVEAELSRLNRDYDVTNAQYQELVKRLETAKLSEQADKTGVVKFDIIEPPSVPLGPVAPNRILLLLAVLILGLAAGGGLAYLMNKLRPVFQHVRSLAEFTGLPVLGSISRTWVGQHKTQARRDVLKYSGGVALLLVAFGALVMWRETGVRLVQQVISG